MGVGTVHDMRVPSRIQLSRRRGWRLPEGASSVAYPTRWANPYRPPRRSAAANADAVERYRAHLERCPELVEQARTALAGRDLACWCPPDLPCHADVLLEVVAGRPSTAGPSAGSGPVERRGDGRPDSDDGDHDGDQDGDPAPTRPGGGQRCHEP